MEIQNTATWADLGLSSEMLEQIKQANYNTPTAVQAQAIPLVLQGFDVLASSQTGSGKTASFVIPAVERFKGKNGTYILALSPTREIAQQTGAVFEAFASAYGMKVAVCIGGASIPVEKEALAASPHIIVATPGRLCDHLERGNVWLDFIQCLIFDEADRMLEMGFAKQIDTITEQIPKERQTLMFSATFSPTVEKLARKAMREPKEVIIKRTVESAPKIDQRLFWISEDQKLGNLIRILRHEKGTMFVFVKAKERAYQVWRSLQNAGFESVTYIHSDLPQDARELAVADFKSGKYRVIIATDVMGRGIDVDDVAHVVNYDVPREAADYVHRIGRTGRRGLTGHASTFAVPGKDDKAIKDIEKLRGVPAPKPGERPARPQGDGPQGNRPQRSRPRDDHRPRSENKEKLQSVKTPEMPQKTVAAAAAGPQTKPGILSRIISFFKR
ncbi:MAG: DEAD/DEAH box helicase [Bacteriovoracaceae bacterium]|nr:DEAD/DEAH box helicase [Bacteriovoracaceae bacterium]